MYPSPERPALGSFVRDQVAALRRTGDAELEVFAFEPRGYARAAAALRHRRGFDIVHAHYGLTLWPALAAGGRKRAGTRHGTDLRTGARAGSRSRACARRTSCAR